MPEMGSPGSDDPSASGGSGLGRAFARGHPALIVYLMAGYPDRAGALDAMRVVAEAGADLIELGVPYADPLADGPVIREAADVARKAGNGGFGLAETIGLAAEFVSAVQASGCRDGAVEDKPPVALMTYLNPIMRMTPARAAHAMREAGVSGVIVPDMPPDAAAPWLAAAEGLDTVFLVAPTSTPERMALVGERSQGFVYCVSTTGVTGERAELPSDLVELVESVKASTSLPVAVGFGVSTPMQAGLIAGFADGVVVGSGAVRRQDDPGALKSFVSDLAGAVHSAR
jgi:tryptophan synthase alpha chain